jgi:hypothetical protein
VGIAFVYCNYKEDHSVEDLLGSILQQLAQRRSSVSESIRNLYKSHIWKQTRPSITETVRTLQSEIQSLAKVFIVVDALDEYSELDEKRSRFLANLRKLTAAQFVVTSRPHISTDPEYFTGVSILEVRASSDDIKAFIHGRISDPGKLKRLVQEDHSLRGEIVDTIIKSANGMYIPITSTYKTLIFKGFF